MINPYKNSLNHFFNNLLYFRHISGRVNKIFQNEIEVYNEEKSFIYFSSLLIISDWTAPTDNGWEKNFNSGTKIETNKENYTLEINKIKSRQFCLLYAQSYESFERFLKNCLFDRLGRDDSIKQFVMDLKHKNQKKEITRFNMPGGKYLFEVLKFAGGKSYIDFNVNNNLNIRLEDLWNVLSEVRHAITHSESRIELKKINNSAHQYDIFNYLFDSKIESDNILLIELEIDKFERTIKRFSEFAFQIFKILSIEENLEWDILEQ